MILERYLHQNRGRVRQSMVESPGPKVAADSTYSAFTSAGFSSFIKPEQLITSRSSPLELMSLKNQVSSKRQHLRELGLQLHQSQELFLRQAA